MSAADFAMPLSLRQYDGLDLLSTAVLLLDNAARIVHVNQAAELLF
jgi:hypothetical protein